MNLEQKYEVCPELHYHNSGDPVKDAFLDALGMQYERIRGNLKKAFPKKTDDEISALMRYGEEI